MFSDEHKNRPMNQHGGPAGGRPDSRMGRPGHPPQQRNGDAQGLNEGMQHLNPFGPGRPNPNETRPAGNVIQYRPNQQGLDIPPGFAPQNGGRLGDFVKLLNGDVVFVPPGLEPSGPYFVPTNQQNQQGPPPYPPQAPTPVPIFSCPPPMASGAMNPMPPGAMMGVMGPQPGADSMSFPGPQSSMFGPPPDNCWVNPMFLHGSGGPGVGPSSQDFQQAAFPGNDDPQAEAVKNQLMHQFLCEQQKEQQPEQHRGPAGPQTNGPHQQGPAKFGQSGVDGSDVGTQVVSKVVDRMLYMLVPDTTKRVYRDMCTNFLVQPMMCPDWSAFIKLEEAAQLGLRGSFAVIAVDKEGSGSGAQQDVKQNADASATDGQNQKAKAPQVAQQPRAVINAVASGGQSGAETSVLAGQSTMTPTAGPLSSLLPMGFAGNDAAKQFHVGIPGGKPEQQPPLMPRPPQVQVGPIPEGENIDRAAKIIHQIGRYVYAVAHCCTYEPAICLMLHCRLRPLAEKMRWKHPAINGLHKCGDGSCAKFRPPIVRNLQPQPILFTERSNNNSHDHRVRADGRRSRLNSSSSSSGGSWMNGNGHGHNHGNGHGRGEQKLGESFERPGSNPADLVVLPVSKKYVDAVKTNVNGGDGDQQDARKNDANNDNRYGKDNGGARKKHPQQ